MDTELLNLTSIYKNTAREISSSAKSWKNFLTFASQFYQYSFENIIFIYAQNKNATMMATLTEWFEKGRIVNPYQKGIVIFDCIGGEDSNRYLFDISQTHGKPVEKPFMIRRDDIKPLNERLNRRHELNARSFPTCVRQIIKANVKATCGVEADKFAQMLEKRGYDSGLTAKLKEGFRPLVKESCFFLASQRCGYGLKSDFYKSFGYLRDYHSPLFISRVGNIVIGESRRALLDVEKDLTQIHKERKSDYEYGEITGGTGEEKRRYISQSQVFGQSGGQRPAGEVREGGVQMAVGERPCEVGGLPGGWQPDEKAPHGGEGRGFVLPASGPADAGRGSASGDSSREGKADEGNTQVCGKGNDGKRDSRTDIASGKYIPLAPKEISRIITAFNINYPNMFLYANQFDSEPYDMAGTDFIKSVHRRLSRYLEDTSGKKQETQNIFFLKSEAKLIHSCLAKQDGNNELSQKFTNGNPEKKSKTEKQRLRSQPPVYY